MIIKSASQDQFSIAVKWAGEEGWNPGIDDLSAFFATDPNGFLLGFIDDKPMAAISIVKYGSGFGFLGFFIVKNNYRGQGYGIQIWNAGMNYLAGRNIGLDGVVAQQENYKKSGFKYAHKNIRYMGKPGSQVTNVNSNIVTVDQVSFEEILAYDNKVFPENRANFLKNWLCPDIKSRKTLIYLDDGDIKGFGTISACLEGHKIGPLFAHDTDIAKQLFKNLCREVNAGLVFLDIPQTNKQAVQLASTLGLEPSFETARMYTSFEPDIDLQKLYGISTFELG